MIAVVQFGREFFIWDGHKRTSASLFNNVPFVPILILGKDNDEIHAGHKVSTFVAAAYKLSLLYDWEDFHGFTFESYPKIEVNSK